MPIRHPLNSIIVPAEKDVVGNVADPAADVQVAAAVRRGLHPIHQRVVGERYRREWRMLFNADWT